MSNQEPAFPQKEPLTSDAQGMTLRDYFAAKALGGMLASPPIVDRAGVAKPVWANHAYAWADAMLEARKKD